METLRSALADRYDLLGPIGQGGMATVWKARDRRHESIVAVKLLRPEIALSIGDVRFTREIQLTASLQHPHILPVLDSGSAGLLPYYIMPFVEGESLAQRLKREDRLTIDEAVRLAGEVADALAHAHAAGIVHRDIKPGNILLSHGHAIVADFGVAKALEDSGAHRLTESGVAMGTVAYMAPEQASGEKVDGRSDQYALACVLYEALAGTPPFTGASAQTIMARHAVDPVPNLRTVRPSVPQALAAAIETALAKVPQDRFPSMRAFREALEVGAAQPATAPSAVFPARVSAAATPARARWIALGALLVAVAGGAGLLARRVAPSTALDAHRVMVLPLVLPADWRGPASAGEDAATLIGSAMDGAGALRWVDGWSRLPAEARRDVRRLGPRDVLRLAREARCAWAISGRIIARADSAEVVLELLDVGGDSVVARSAPRAAATDATWRGGLAAVTLLLPHLIPGAPPDIAAPWTARPPQAVADFLAGEAAFRRVAPDSALAAFRRAVAADSTFALAAVRGAQSASWAHQTGEARALARLALRHPLGPRDAAFARGVAAYLDGAADSAATALHAAIASDSALLPAWLQLGEVYIHLLPAQGRPDSLAEAAFQVAERLDTASVAARFHQVELAARRGDRTRVELLARAFVRSAADSQFVREVRLMAACDGRSFVGVPLDDIVRTSPLALLLTAKSLAGEPATARCARAAYVALLAGDSARTDDADGRRFVTLLGLVAHEVAAGREADAVAAVEQFVARWGVGRTVYLLLAPVVPGARAAAEQLARDDAAAHGADYAGVALGQRRWEQGVLAATAGRAEVARAVARRFAERLPDGSRLDSVMATSMAAHAALAAGDSALARTMFDRLIRARQPSMDLLPWDEVATLGFDRLQLGRLWLAAGEPARAIDVLDVLDSSMPVLFPLYQPASLALRITAAERLGQAARARALRARAAAWRTP